MPKLYQHQLKNNLIALNEGVNHEQIDGVIEAISNCIKLNKKYFPDDHLKIFDEIVKEELSFENIFNIALNSKAVQDKRDGDPLLIFLSTALCDICTDHKHDFIGQTHQKLVKIIRDSEERPETNPEMDELYSNIRDYDEDCINSEFNSKKTHSHHTLNTGNWLIEFLKSHIEIEREAQEAAAEEVQKQSSWVDRVSTAASVSEVIPETSKKKSVSFAASSIKDNSSNGKGSGIL